MGGRQHSSTGTGRRRGFRGRLLLSFIAPVLILGVGAFILVEVIFAQALGPLGLSILAVRAVMAGLILLALLAAAALALQAGDRFTRPVGWLLRAIDAGQIRLLSQLPPPEADWELMALCDRVRVLLHQNLSGAKALEELEALRLEVSAVLDCADRAFGHPDAWRQIHPAHELTQRLLDFFQKRYEHLSEAVSGLKRLQGLLEQDWREETLAIEEIVKRAEGCFIQQTQVAVELERLERLLSSGRDGASSWDEIANLLEDLRAGIARWQAEVVAILESSAPGAAGRLEEWNGWVDESLEVIETALARTGKEQGGTRQRLVSGMEKVSGEVGESSQEISALSREAVQLQRAWARLGERLRTLVVRAGEVCDGSPQGGLEGD